MPHRAQFALKTSSGPKSNSKTLNFLWISSTLECFPYSQPARCASGCHYRVRRGLGGGGGSAELLWEALLAGRSCISTIERYQVRRHEFAHRRRGEGFRSGQTHSRQRLKPKRIARQGQFAIVATEEAVKDARLGFTAQLRSGGSAPSCSGHPIATSGEVSEATLKVENRGPSYISPGAVALCSMQTQMSAIISMLEIEDTCRRWSWRARARRASTPWPSEAT